MKRTGTINWPVRRLSMARIVASKKTIWFQWCLDFSIIRKLFGFLELVECFFINISSSYPNHNHLSSYCLTAKATSLSEEETPSLRVGLSLSRWTSSSTSFPSFAVSLLIKYDLLLSNPQNVLHLLSCKTGKGFIE